MLQHLTYNTMSMLDAYVDCSMFLF